MATPTTSAAHISVHPLTRDRWDDLAVLFGDNGACAGCWDMYYRLPAKDYSAAGNTRLRDGEDHRDALRALVASGHETGLLAYLGADPAGWCALGPRADFPRLARSRVFAPADETPAWIIVCFFTQRRWRHQGVATALLRATLAYARERGAPAVEACPVAAPEGGVPDAFIWNGAEAMFRAAGFREIARRSPTRPLMRYDL